MASKKTPRPCACGATYEAHRLGMSFADARRMLWDIEDPSRPGWWRQKRRHGVLGFMRELKIHSFYAIHSYCDEMKVAA